MKCIRKVLPALLSATFVVPLLAQTDTFKDLDGVTLKDGTQLRGLIVRNTKDSVTLQQEYSERIIPKEDILRISDHPDILYTDAPKKGDLPAWRVIANDLRSHDQIKTLVEIPATAIDQGPFKNVPYKCFSVNKDLVLNIFGDPNDPAAIMIGIFGHRSGNQELRKTLRAYLAGFLTTRKEIGALYAVNLDGGIAEAGNMTFKIVPKDSPNSYGAWWIILCNEKDLADVRLDDAEYARLTQPFDHTFDGHGNLLEKWTAKVAAMTGLGENEDDGDQTVRGFYRDKNGDFRLITDSNSH